MLRKLLCRLGIHWHVNYKLTDVPSCCNRHGYARTPLLHHTCVDCGHEWVR